MDDGPADDDDLAWPPPEGSVPPSPRPAPSADAPMGAPEPGRIDRSGAAASAGLFGALAGLTLPPLLFWVTFSLVGWIGAPDTVTALGSLGVAFGVPLLLFFRIMGLLGRSSPRYDGARTALTVAASATLGMWFLLAVVAVLAIVVLRSMG